MFPLLLIIRSKLNKKLAVGNKMMMSLQVMMMIKTVNRAKEARVKVNLKRRTCTHEKDSTENLVHAKTRLIISIQHGLEEKE